MARNKYPEETVNLILDVSVKLFLTKGYDNTSIQDIINHLGGLSKGAIYHHFKSKDSILIAVYERLSEELESQVTTIRDDPTLTGMQKLKKVFMSSIDSIHHRELLASSPKLLDNPKLLAIQMKSSIYDVIPNYIEPIIRQGVKDGSIKTDYPKELAQVLILLSNTWMNPVVYPMTAEDVVSKIGFFNQLTTALGLSIIDENLEHYLKDFQHLTEEKQQYGK